MGAVHNLWKEALSKFKKNSASQWSSYFSLQMVGTRKRTDFRYTRVSMHRHQPPENLPVVPVNFRRPWESEPASGAPAAERQLAGTAIETRWGSFELSDDDVRELRAALEEDLGRVVVESDDEIRQMAYDTILALDLLARIAERRVRE